MNLKDRTTHLMVMLPVDMVKEIEVYKEEHRIRTTHKAIRTLISKGLEDSTE